jgi:hypothetical protein
LEPQYKPFTMLFPAPDRKVRDAAGCLNGLIFRLKARPVSQAAQRPITAFCARRYPREQSRQGRALHGQRKPALGVSSPLTDCGARKSAEGYKDFNKPTRAPDAALAR